MDLNVRHLLFTCILSAQALAQDAASPQTNAEAVQKHVEKDTTSDEVSTSQAQAMNSSINLETKEINKKEKKWRTSLQLEAETDFKETSDEEKSYGSSMTLIPRYQINSEYSAGAIIIVDKDLSSSYETKMSGLDSRVFISKTPIDLTDNIKLAPSVRFIYPSSNTSKVRDEMLGGVELDPTLVYALSDKLSLSYLPRLRRDFHKYTTNRENKSNSEYRLLQFFGASYSFTEKWSFSPTLLYTKKWSYSGRQQNDSYLTILSLGYQYSQALSFSVYTLTGGNVFETERGPDEVIKVFDEDSTSIVLNGTVVF